MGYRDERRALEDRATALREEIDELLTELEHEANLADGREREEFWGRADELPDEVQHHRTSMSGMRPFILFGVGALSLVGAIAIFAENPVEERVGGFVAMVVFMAIFFGFVALIFGLKRGRSVDLLLDGEGLRTEGKKGVEQLPWHDLERLRLRVDIMRGKNGTTRTGYLAVRCDGVWSAEHILEDISQSTEAGINRWVDWLLGVQIVQSDPD